MDWDWICRNSQMFNFFWKKNQLKIFKFTKGGEFAVELVLDYIIFSKCHSHLKWEVFFRKKLEIFQIRKKTWWGKTIFWEKNVFIFSKGIFKKMGRQKIFQLDAAVWFAVWFHPRLDFFFNFMDKIRRDLKILAEENYSNIFEIELKHRT